MKILFLAALLIAHPASAVEFYLEGGQCHFEDTGGAFYASDLPHTNYMTPRCGGLGLRDKFENSDFGWRIGYAASGSIQARDNLVRVVDGSMEGIPCDFPHSYNGCHATINGSGYMYGFAFAINRSFHVYDRFSVVPEGGLFFFRSVFRANIRPYDYCCREALVIEDSHWKAAPAPFAGLTLRYGPAYVAARYHWSSGHRALSLTNQAFSQLVLGLSL